MMFNLLLIYVLYVSEVISTGSMVVLTMFVILGFFASASKKVEFEYNKKSLIMGIVATLISVVVTLGLIHF